MGDLNKAKGTALLRDPRARPATTARSVCSRTHGRSSERSRGRVWPTAYAQATRLLSRAEVGQRVFARAMRLLGIEDPHFHDLRHEATARLFENGYCIHEVAHFTLHESWTTLKQHTQLKPEDVPERRALDADTVSIIEPRRVATEGLTLRSIFANQKEARYFHGAY